MKIVFRLTTLIIFLSIAFFPSEMQAQKKKKKNTDTEETKKHALDELSVSGLKFRAVGPALTSGRISDIAVHPENPFIYYVATASGGVWKTVNNGTTFKPIFDSQGSYSIGCVVIDPSNYNRIWVGTGENNNQRSVAYGDGIYRSDDGGKSWKHMGLKNSEHIGKIIVHPDNSDKVYVAAIGPLWSSGGDRGVYKTTDAGETWVRVLGIDEHTGVNDIVMDPANPSVLYAAALQRRRHVFTYIGGGPGSGMHKTVDGGKTWNKINKGLPKVDIGRIGLCISPADPEIIYAMVEAADGKGGTFWTRNRGASWEKRGKETTSGNYYQEIIPDPHDPMTLYSMNTWMKVSKDGGKSFKIVGEDTKHVDNHSMWIDPDNTKHWLVGCDGGIYETFDAAKTWDFKANLPVTQFYKVAVDNATPFYNIYGGTQDNFSIGGPSRTNTAHGIVNEDWFITHGGDGFETQIDPDDPNIVYAQSQYGVLVRYDKMSGEEVGIQPKPRKGENNYRWNWDAPLQVSAHKPGRLYFSANKVFRTDDKGNSWTVISEDLTAQINRNELKVMGKVYGVDAVMKNQSTSPYGTIVAFSESPVNQDLLIAGTDDGLIQITEDGGDSWRKVSSFPGVPSNTYVNAVYASQYDENVIYAAFNNHKKGDFKPYLFRSNDKGISWKNISNNLPERGSTYAFDEDHVNKDLLFCGTEFGVFFSPNGGQRWKQLKAGVPTIAVRDIAIQRRENDLVLGTFGRSFYVLDDYSALRSIDGDGKMNSPQLLATRDALMFESAVPLGLPGKSFQGDSYFTAENLGSEALITYFFDKDIKTLKDQRKKNQKKLNKDGKDIPYPSYDDLKAEQDEIAPKLVFSITNADGVVVKKLEKKPSKGIKRFKWDMRYTSKRAISFSSPSFYNPFAGKREGTLVEPGTYTATMSTYIDGEMTQVGDPVEFDVVPLKNTVMPASDRQAKVAFQRDVAELSREIETTQRTMGEVSSKVKHIKKAIQMSEVSGEDLMTAALELESSLRALRISLNGDRIKNRLDIDQPPGPASRIGSINYEQKYSTSAPTKTHRDSYGIAKEEFVPIKDELERLIQNQLVPLENKLDEIQAPFTPGRALREKN
ncbi:MAG: glycosyl hydrolase [Saprospiraceae bacterium]|nr:glycosyl hydrolase [Saprospiraceae bacterium]